MIRTGAVLVAAGMSTRMKAFKPMLPFQDTTISRYLVRNLRLSGVDPIVVVIGYRAQELEEHLGGYGIQFVTNPNYAHTQMFDSAKLGFKAICGKCDRILMMPMDIPGVRIQTFSLLIKQNTKIVRACYHGQPGHPIILDVSLLGELCDYKGSEGMRGALCQTGAEILDVETEDETICLDVDTPMQYQRLLSCYCEKIQDAG